MLQQQRIKGAKKEGRVWKIPSLGARSLGRETRPGSHRLIKGIPQIKECNRGLKGTWRRKRCDKITRIHVNKPQINHNRKHKTLEPVITIRQGSRKTSCHIAEVKGSCRVVYQPYNPLPCGAVVWIEVLPNTVVIPQLLTPMRVGIFQ